MTFMTVVAVVTNVENFDFAVTNCTVSRTDGKINLLYVAVCKISKISNLEKRRIFFSNRSEFSNGLWNL